METGMIIPMWCIKIYPRRWRLFVRNMALFWFALRYILSGPVVRNAASKVGSGHVPKIMAESIRL